MDWLQAIERVLPPGTDRDCVIRVGNTLPSDGHRRRLAQYVLRVDAPRKGKGGWEGAA